MPTTSSRNAFDPQLKRNPHSNTTPLLYRPINNTTLPLQRGRKRKLPSPTTHPILYRPSFLKRKKEILTTSHNTQAILYRPRNIQKYPTHRKRKNQMERKHASAVEKKESYVLAQRPQGLLSRCKRVHYSLKGKDLHIGKDGF